MNIQDFTTPILKTSGTRTLEYRVVDTTPEDINTYLSHHIKGSYIALPANSDVLSDLCAQDFNYLIVRAAYQQPSDHKLVYTAIVIVPSYTCIWNKGVVTTPVAPESLKKVGQAPPSYTQSISAQPSIEIEQTPCIAPRSKAWRVATEWLASQHPFKENA